LKLFSRKTQDRFAYMLMGMLAWCAVMLVPGMLVALYLRARPLLDGTSLGQLLLARQWSPMKGQFGYFPFLMGTLWVTFLAMALAIPPCFLSAIYLAEYAPRWLRQAAKPMVDLLAGIPSVVYGLWGILAVVPFLREVIIEGLAERRGSISWLPAANPTGYSVMAGGIVLAVMVSPIIISTVEEVLRAVPRGQREAALALGATQWQVVKSVVVRRAMPGIIAAVMLGFSRAFGETMAVMMVVGNVAQIPRSPFDAAYPLSALIANNYGEMMSIPLYDAALMTAALLLLLTILVFTILARIVLLQSLKEVM